MTSQRTHKESTPDHAVRKVPVPQGSKCQRETVQFGFQDKW